MVKPNTSDGVEPLPLVTCQELKGDQARSDTSLEYDEFELSYNDDMNIFNKLVRPRGAMHCFGAPPKIFIISYTCKRIEVLSTLGVFKPKNDKRHARLM